MESRLCRFPSVIVSVSKLKICILWFIMRTKALDWEIRKTLVDPAMAIVAGRSAEVFPVGSYLEWWNYTDSSVSKATIHGGRLLISM